jgi:hypothetical protein
MKLEIIEDILGGFVFALMIMMLLFFMFMTA